MFTRSSLRAPLTAALAAGALLVPAAGALAADADVTFSLEGAAAPVVTAPAFTDFGTITLNGTRQSTAAEVGDWQVTDATGKAEGWRVTMEASAPENADGSSVLSTAAISLATPAVTAADPQNTSDAPSASGGDLLQSGGRTVANADQNGGMGVWNFAQGSDDLTLTIPSDAKADDYTTTITTTVIAGSAV